MFPLVIRIGWRTDWSQLRAAPPWSSLSGSHTPSASWQPRPLCCHPRPSFSLQQTWRIENCCSGGETCGNGSTIWEEAEGCAPDYFLARSSDFLEMLLPENCFHLINSLARELAFLHLGFCKDQTNVTWGVYRWVLEVLVPGSSDKAS